MKRWHRDASKHGTPIKLMEGGGGNIGPQLFNLVTDSLAELCTDNLEGNVVLVADPLTPPI